MKIEPPSFEATHPQQAGRRMSSVATMLITFGIILLITLIAWMMLWGGGISSAAKDKVRPEVGQRS